MAKLAACTSGSFNSLYPGLISWPLIANSYTSAKNGSAAFFFASGMMTDGTCVTKQGSISVGSISFS